MGSGRQVGQPAEDSGGAAAPNLWDVDTASARPGEPPLHADDLPDGVVVADARGRVVLFNTMAAQLTGVPVESALGRDYRTALPSSPFSGRYSYCQLFLLLRCCCC